LTWKYSSTSTVKKCVVVECKGGMSREEEAETELLYAERFALQMPDADLHRLVSDAMLSSSGAMR
jgi:hypothetical protein